MMKPEDIDWNSAPEGATHYDPGSNLDDDPASFMRFDETGCYFWDGEQWDEYGEVGEYTCAAVKARSIPLPAEKVGVGDVTVERLIKLSKESGFEVDIHPNGKLYVWDDEMDAHATGTLEEIIELCEAKKEWLKVWTKFTWS